MRVSEIRVKQIRVNQGLGVLIFGTLEYIHLKTYQLSTTLIWVNKYVGGNKQVQQPCSLKFIHVMVKQFPAVSKIRGNGFHKPWKKRRQKQKTRQGTKVRLIKSSHCLYRILDSKKTSCFQFSVPGLREIHRNLKQQKKFHSRESFFRKSPFCTFSCINPGIGRPWGMLWIFFLIERKKYKKGIF